MKTYKKMKDERKTQIYGREKISESSTEITLHRVTDITMKETVCNEFNKVLKITGKSSNGEKITFKLFLNDDKDNEVKK